VIGVDGVEAALGASEGGGDVDGKRLLLFIEAEEGNVSAVGRPSWSKFIGGVGAAGEAARGVGGADLGDVNVGVVAFFTGPDEGDLVAVGREGGVAFARKTVQRSDANFGAFCPAEMREKIPSNDQGCAQ
jgi:hypothetical protein